MKTIEITDEAFKILDESMTMSGAGLNDYSEVIEGMERFIKTLLYRKAKLEKVLAEIKRHGYDWHHENCGYDQENEETCTCSCRKLDEAIRACNLKGKVSQ